MKQVMDLRRSIALGIGAIILSFGASFTLAEESPRVWTSLNGKTIEASLVSAKGSGEIELKRGSRVIKMNARSLSFEDQAYIQTYLKQNQDPADAAKEAGFTDLPKSMLARVTSESRSREIKAAGGDADTQTSAIQNALKFLEDQQGADGSATQGEYSVAMTAFALLCFSGEAQTGDVSEATQKMVNFLTSARGKEGWLTSADSNNLGGTYENGIATYALADYLALAKAKGIPNLSEVERAVERGLKPILNGQHEAGGWSYGYKKGAGDTCLSGWQFQALRSAHEAGVGRTTSIERAMTNVAGFFKEYQGPEGGFAYQPQRDKKSKASLSGIGPMIFERWGMNDSAETGNAMAYLNSLPPRGTSYAWYFYGQAYRLTGGADWQKWHQAAIPQIINSQELTGEFSHAVGHGPKDNESSRILKNDLEHSAFTVTLPRHS